MTRAWGVCRSNRWNITCVRSSSNAWKAILHLRKTTDTLKPAKTPFLDEPKLESTHNDSKEGLLQPIACKVLMKILYGARLARFALLRPIAALASKITKWDTVRMR